MDKIFYIGIDFSVVSPSICIRYPNGEYKFISFFDDYGKNYKTTKLKKFHYHKELSNIIDLIPYTRHIVKDNYRDEQTSKMKSAKYISNLISSKIKEIVGDNKVYISIEGFSYGSISSSTLDLALYNSFLRIKLLEIFGDECLVIISPKEGKKKLSGKGNANKDVMINAFINDNLHDENLIKNPFWIYCKNNNLDYNNIKPIDDLVDSYAILNSI